MKLFAALLLFPPLCFVCRAVAIASKEPGKVVQRKRLKWSLGPTVLSWSRV